MKAKETTDTSIAKLERELLDHLSKCGFTADGESFAQGGGQTTLVRMELELRAAKKRAGLGPKYQLSYRLPYERTHKIYPRTFASKPAAKTAALRLGAAGYIIVEQQA